MWIQSKVFYFFVYVFLAFLLAGMFLIIFLFNNFNLWFYIIGAYLSFLFTIGVFFLLKYNEKGKSYPCHSVVVYGNSFSIKNNFIMSVLKVLMFMYLLVECFLSLLCFLGFSFGFEGYVILGVQFSKSGFLPYFLEAFIMGSVCLSGISINVNPFVYIFYTILSKLMFVIFFMNVISSLSFMYFLFSVNVVIFLMSINYNVLLSINFKSGFGSNIILNYIYFCFVYMKNNIVWFNNALFSFMMVTHTTSMVLSYLFMNCISLFYLLKVSSTHLELTHFLFQSMPMVGFYNYKFLVVMYSFVGNNFLLFTYFYVSVIMIFLVIGGLISNSFCLKFLSYIKNLFYNCYMFFIGIFKCFLNYIKFYLTFFINKYGVIGILFAFSFFIFMFVLFWIIW